jgi:hypothetical protein
MFKRPRRRTAVLTTIALLVVAASAYAYWSTIGSGSGSATTGTSSSVTIAQTNTVSGLYPGGPAQDVEYKITNPASGNQYVATVAVSISSVTKAGTPATGCTAADFTLTQPAAIAQDLPSGDTAFTGTKAAKLQMKNTATNQDGCKGVTVNLAFNAS